MASLGCWKVLGLRVGEFLTIAPNGAIFVCMPFIVNMAPLGLKATKKAKRGRSNHEDNIKNDTSNDNHIVAVYC